MPVLNRVLYNVLCMHLGRSVAFYRDLFAMATLYESDWYVVLTPHEQTNVQLGLIAAASEFTPAEAKGSAAGSYLTFVVADVNATVVRARGLGAEVVEMPRALAYGQTRALIRDPDGAVVDISTPTDELRAASAA